MALINCRHCETPNPDTARVCATCGRPLSPADSPAVSPPSRSLSGTRTAAGPGTGSGREAGEPFGPRYRLLERLGKGGMGEVWKARDLELDQMVALKMIRPDLLEEADLVERFKQEITLARKVTHKNVTRIYDLGEVEGTRFITMEYLEGVNLKEFIRQEGPLPEEKAIPIIRGICEGLKAAHDVGVIHRDLKPQNILIDHDGQAHIMDFGIAFSGETAGLTRTGALIGTPEYMSPEQVRGERLDVRSDIYSLGLILYEMVTKDLPFTADSVASSMYKRLSEKPRRPREIREDLPAFLEKIILRCLEKERSFRYADVGEILLDIQQRQAPGLGRGYLASRLRRRAVAITAVLVLAGLAVGVAILFRNGVLTVSRRGSPAPPPVTSVAVFPFQNTAGDPKSEWIRGGLANLLTTDLAQAPGIRVVSSARLAQTLNDLHLADFPAFDAGTLQKVAGFLDAQMVLSGSFVSLGGRLRVDAQIFRIQGKEAIQDATLKAEADGEQGLFALVDGLARQVREKMGASPDQIRAERPREIKQVTTASVPALREYMGALGLLQRGSYLEAVEGFRKAVEIDPGFATAHARLGEAYLALGRDPEAQKSLDAAAEHLDRVSDREGLLIQALQAKARNDTDAAVRNYESLAKRFPNDPEIHYDLATVYDEKARDYDRAIENYRKAIAGDAKYAAALFGLGRAQFRKGDYGDALQSFQSALAVQTELSNDEGKATALNGLGAACQMLGRDDEAVRYYRQSADLKKKLGDESGYARSLYNIAQSYRRAGRFDDAVKAVQETLEIRRKLGDREGECFDLDGLGSIHADAGRYDEALKAHQESLKIAREIDDPMLTADNLGNIGAVYLAMGRYSDADVFYQQALETRRRIGSKDGILRSLVDLGYLQLVEGAPDRSLQHYLEAMQIAREIQDQNAVNEVSVNLGELYVEQGHYRSALATLEEALKDLRAGGDQTTVATALKDSGDLLGRLGRFAEADSRLAEAEKIAREVRNEILLSDVLTARGEMLFRQGKLAEAGAAFRQALDLSSRHKDQAAILRARIGLSFLAALGGGAAPLSQLSAAADDADTLGNVPLVLSARVALARACLRAGKKSQAAVEAGKAVSKEAGFDGGELLFQANLLLGLARLGEPGGAAAAGDLSRALEIFEKIRSELADPSALSGMLGREDLRSDLKELSRGLRESGSAAEADRVASWGK